MHHKVEFKFSLGLYGIDMQANDIAQSGWSMCVSRLKRSYHVYMGWSLAYPPSKQFSIAPALIQHTPNVNVCKSNKLCILKMHKTSPLPIKSKTIWMWSNFWTSRSQTNKQTNNFFPYVSISFVGFSPFHSSSYLTHNYNICVIWPLVKTIQVNISNDAQQISGIFIKNIIKSSPAELCKQIKVCTQTTSIHLIHPLFYDYFTHYFYSFYCLL